MDQDSQPPAIQPTGPGTLTINPADLLKRGIKRFIMAAIGSTLFSAFWFFAHVKSFIACILAAILALFGWGVHPPQDVEDAGKKVIAKLKDEVKDHVPVVGIPNSLHRSPEQIEAIAERKEAERLRREESERKSLLARAAVVDLECDKDSTLETLRVVVPLAERRKEEEPERRLLAARAEKIGLEVDPAWEIKTYREQVKDGEEEARLEADYQAQLRAYEKAKQEYNDRLAGGPNARCPKCHMDKHFGANRVNSKFVCSRCQGLFTVRQAMASWTPPPPPREPTPPKKKQGLLKRLKQAFG